MQGVPRGVVDPMPTSGGAREPGAAVAADLRRFIIEEALPLWAGPGRDRRHGGVHERLHLDGTPDLRAAKRLRVQARQIYVYAHADALGWYPGGQAVAFDILEFMLAAGRAPDGRPGYVHLLTPEGAVADARRDAYDHMFVLLSLTWLARASGDAQVHRLVDETLGLIEALFDDGAGGLIESVPPALPRRQNPHMHAFEAMLALHETLSHEAAAPRIARLRELLEHHFLCAETGLLLEHFDAALGRLATPEGDVVEPGHMVEWAWLLRRHEAMFGLPRGSLASRMLDDGLRFADPATGFLPDEARRGRRHAPHDPPVLAADRTRQGLARRGGGRPRRCRGGRLRGARAPEGLLSGLARGRWLDRPFRRRGPAHCRARAGEHALPCVRRGGGSRPCDRPRAVATAYSGGASSRATAPLSTAGIWPSTMARARVLFDLTASTRRAKACALVWSPVCRAASAASML